MDELLPSVVLDVVVIFIMTIATVIVVVSYSPIVLVPSAVIFVIFAFLRQFYLGSSRYLKLILRWAPP